MRSVGQALSAMGAPDPRLIQQIKIDICLCFQYHAYYKADPPPKRVKSTPIQVLRNIAGIPVETNNPYIQVTCNMIILNLFFLVHPRRYTGT